MNQIIHIHLEAPPKPALGEPCNGCGVCCLAEPCPVGVLVSRRWKGACAALVWSDEARRYHCGLLRGPDRAAASPGATGWRMWQARLIQSLWQRWVRRMISAGSGCDASMEVTPSPGPGDT
jgi:hypothetical protein